MAAIAHPEDRQAQINYLSERTDEYYEQGDTQGDNAALLVAIAICRELLKERTPERTPLDWAMTQNNLGNALAALGERESGTARLQEAVAAYDAALSVFVLTRADYHTGHCRANRERALALLAEWRG
jgi:tetratricopeptide (TPR) repeat protein